MNLKIKFIALLFICLLSTTTSNAQEPMLGEVKIFAGNFAPRGWAFCDGQILPISQNTALFSLLGNPTIILMGTVLIASPSVTVTS